MSMTGIHPTAEIGPNVRLADDVEIGPGCCLTGSIEIDARTVLMGYNFLTGPLRIGKGNRIYPFACLGFEPQDFKFDPIAPNAGVVIGDRNIIREQVTIHRATSADQPTTLGDDNMLMVAVHLGHDVIVGSRCVLVNQTAIGGHAHIGDRVNIGGMAAVIPKVHIGSLAFIGGKAAVRQSVPPFMFMPYASRIGGVNLVGLRRSGMARDEIDRVRKAYRIIFLNGNTRPVAIEKLREQFNQSPAVDELIDFLEHCPGPICRADEKSGDTTETEPLFPKDTHREI